MVSIFIRDIPERGEDGHMKMKTVIEAVQAQA